MTSPEVRLRAALHEAGSIPVGSIDFDQLVQRHHRRARRRRGTAGIAAVAVAALVIWAGTGGNPSAGKATLVPATPPTASPGSQGVVARIVSIARPIVLLDGAFRLDPAGAPPASTASVQRLMAADSPTPYGGRNSHTQLLYGAFTQTPAPSGSVCCGQPTPPVFNRHLAVWIIDHGSVPPSVKPESATVYTAVDPVTAKRLSRWVIDGTPAPSPIPTPFPDLSPGPSVLPPQTGIVDQGGQFHGTYWQGLNGWVKQVGPDSYLSIYAGGQPVDPTLESTGATVAGVLVLTPEDQQKLMLDGGTRYLPSPAPLGKFQIVAVNGVVLTLQLVGTSQTYTFNTSTDTYG